MKKLELVLVILLVLSTSARSQEVNRIQYKQVDSTSLYLEIDYPPGYETTKSYPAIVFYFGGGWNGGTTGHFEPHARYFAERGLVCFRVDYRVNSRQGTTPFESLSINSKELYGSNLELFLEDAKENKRSNLLLLAYGKNWELNILLNTLEKINIFLVKNSENNFDYDDFQEDTKWEIIEKIINANGHKYNDAFTKENIEDIKVKIFQKVHTLLGVNHA